MKNEKHIKQTFTKAERLCSKREIDRLFAEGQSFILFPYSIRWHIETGKSGDVASRVLINVSKRRFRHAVDRNRVKRLMRECYRIHKHKLNEYIESRGLSITLSINYIHKEIMNYTMLCQKMEKLTETLIKEIGKEMDK